MEKNITKDMLERLLSMFGLKQSRGRISRFKPEQTFLIFSVIYFPIALLLLNKGTLSKVLLMIYTAVLFLLGLFLLVRFVIYLAVAANTRNNKIGTLMLMYIVRVMIPLYMFKFLGLMAVSLLPTSHTGLMCELKNMFIDLYHLYNVQQSIDFAILLSAIPILLLALWSVNKGK